MTTKSGGYLAIDLGASSGRAVLGTLAGDVMHMDEVHRFPTPMLEIDGHLYWDIDAMWQDIRAALEKMRASGQRLRSISVDSWAVDYVPIDANGAAVRRPYSYRDTRTNGRMRTAVKYAGGADVLYSRTGIQFLPFNTLPQVIADLEDEPELARRTESRLLIAEYFMFRLSGRVFAEATNASTTQLVDTHTGRWSTALLTAIGDDVSRWPEIVAAGTVLGPLMPGLPGGDDDAPPTIIATCAHDTAAAVAAVPASADRAWAYISSGTWSLVGAELPAHVLTREAREAGFTNEAGLDGTVRFLRNRAGMWVLEELRREWSEAGRPIAIADLMRDAEAAPASACTIDLNAPAFAERGGMTQRIADACEKQDFAAPRTPAAFARLVLESLAVSHANAIHQLETVTAMPVDDVHIVGGGARNDFLSQLTADRTNRRVVAGPAEATVLGNLLVQARTLGDLPRDVTVRDASRRSTTTREFTPRLAGDAAGSPFIK